MVPKPRSTERAIMATTKKKPAAPGSKTVKK
jgi:hypothetical protein